MFQKHINLVRKIAWSFHKTTGIEWSELFSQASLSYLEGMKLYNPEKGAETTWAYQWITSDLINFCKKEQRFKNPTGIDDWYQTSTDEFREVFSTSPNLKPDTKEIVEMVLQEPSRYALPPRKAIGLIRKDLRDIKGWTWPRIESAMRNLRQDFQEPVKEKQYAEV
jgi:DNA-directed RNA polymerase specialized sigma24 family protein